MDITCFSISSADQLDKVYITLNSIKHIKQQNTNIKYYLLVGCDEQISLQYCITYFNPLSSIDFQIIVYNITDYLNYIDPSLPPSPFMYLKCFAPGIFEEDKILYLDTDILFIKKGIQELWNTNIDDYYVAAVEEPLVTYYYKLQYELTNTKTENYFNSGVMLLNFKNIREDKIDVEMAQMVNKWDRLKVQPVSPDQSLLNYLLRDKVKLIDYKFNNTILVSTPKVQHIYINFLKEKYNGISLTESLDQAIVLHFLGLNKPWDEKVRKFANTIEHFPYKNQCLEIWDYFENLYKHP